MTVAQTSPKPGTAYEVIRDAYQDAGLLGEGDEPNSEAIVTAKRRLNKLINYLQTRGIKLWVQEDIAICPVEGVRQYQLGPTGNVPMLKPRRVIEAYYSDGFAENRRPLIMMSRNEWNSLSTINTLGTITSFYVDKQQDSIKINLWLIPDAIAAMGQVHLIVDQQIGNFNQITDEMNFPPEWALCLEWGLAAQLCTGQPSEIVQRCTQNAMFFQTELENWDVEDASTFFQPDPRAQFSNFRFRA